MNARGSARERMGGTRAPPHHQVDHQPVSVETVLQPARQPRAIENRRGRAGPATRLCPTSEQPCLPIGQMGTFVRGSRPRLPFPQPLLELVHVKISQERAEREDGVLPAEASDDHPASNLQ